MIELIWDGKYDEAGRRGAPAHKVQAMARHASIDTTMIYYHEIDRLSDPAERYIVYNGLNDEGSD